MVPRPLLNKHLFNLQVAEAQSYELQKILKLECFLIDTVPISIPKKSYATRIIIRVMNIPKTTPNKLNSFLDNIHKLPASLRSCTDKTLALIKTNVQQLLLQQLLYPLTFDPFQTKVITVT